MNNFEFTFKKYRENLKGVIRHLLDYFTLLMCLKDTEETGIEKEKSEAMEKSVDCPLCLEPLEFDDKNFYPCTCGYQVCRFCWHRIRTNENGLCPACRRIYSENPANFQPLTPEEMQKVKHQKKMKDIQKKQKMAENRKQLANIRVIQKNLVFAVGLPLELSQDNEKKEKVLLMFRQFGATQKETITDRTSYAGSLGPSACVYITYQKPEDAVRAVKYLTNTKIEGRTIKVSLGTTKYCSNFLKNAHCVKAECLYLHELADEEASFTKEDIHLGKHLEYEQKLIEQTLNTPHNKVSQSNETNRTNHNRNTDECSESSDDLHQNNSFYDSSEASDLSPSNNPQNLENMRNIGSDLNCEIENNHESVHVTNSDLRANLDSLPKQPMFRTEENIIVNNHSSNSSIHENSITSNYRNQILHKENEAVQQPNFLNNQIFDCAVQCRGQSSKESSFLRLINSSSLIDSNSKYPSLDIKRHDHVYQDHIDRSSKMRENGPDLDSKYSSPDVKSMYQELNRRSKMRDDDPDLEFDPCQESLNGLQALMISEAKEKARIHYNTLNRSPISNNRSPTLPSVEPFDVIGFRNPPMKMREPPPGFSNNLTQHIHFKSPYELGSVNKAPIPALHNPLGVRTNYGVTRYAQPVPPSSNSFLPDFTSTLSRDIPDIIPPVFQQQQQQQQQHNQQRLMNLSQIQYSVPEQQRSSPLWNNASQSQWRPMENLFFNQGISENRATNDFNLRMPVRSNDLTMRQWQQQQQLPGNVNNSPFQELSQINHEQAKIQAMYKSLEAASRNSPSFSHNRLQYTKKL